MAGVLTNSVNVCYGQWVAESLNSLLRELRESRGTSLRQVAQDVDVNPAYLSRVERGQKGASKSVQERLADYYDIEPELVAMASGELPEDIVGILRGHPELVEELRQRFATS